MFRALWIKEWTQLAGLRWSGLALGAMMPVLATAAAEAGKRGWMPLGQLNSYSMRGLLLDALPALYPALWGLLALLLVSQAHAADRAAGTEGFLLERPVRRSRVWLARTLAAGASTLALIAAHMLLWFGLAEILVAPSTPEWGVALGVLAGFASAAVPLGLLGGLAAGTWVRSPIQAVLLGLILGGLPPAMAVFLAGVFPLVWLFGVPLGAVVPWILPAGYLIASWVAACRGEPAGRGRTRRAVTVLVAFVVATPLLMLAAAPFAVRYHTQRNLNYVLASNGSAAVALGGWPASAGYIVDLDSGRRIRLLAPGLLEAEWNDDGSLLAVITEAGPLGTRRSNPRLELFDAAGERLGEPLELSSEVVIRRMRWAGDRVVWQELRAQSDAVVFFDPTTGSGREITIGPRPGSWRLVGPDGEGRMYVYRLVASDPNRFELNRLEPESGGLSEPLRVESGVKLFGWQSVSPSGRYWLRTDDVRPAMMRIVDLSTGEEVPLPGAVRGRWLPDERLLWLAREGERINLRLGTPGGPVTTLQSVKGHNLDLELAPDGARVILREWTGDEEGTPRRAFRLSGLRLIDLASGRQVDLIETHGASFFEGRTVSWAGPSSLALISRGGFDLLDVAGESRRRRVVRLGGSAL